MSTECNLLEKDYIKVPPEQVIGSDWQKYFFVYNYKNDGKIEKLVGYVGDICSNIESRSNVSIYKKKSVRKTKPYIHGM